jgi:type IV pilus assembly protein PilV
MKSNLRNQSGSSLIEVLVAVLILSFGMLALGGMLAYAVQMPKLAALRATATNLAASHIERMRANITGFRNGSYDENLTYSGATTVTALNNCSYPSCTATSLATMDKATTLNSLRRELPAGGLRMERDGTSGTTVGNLWIIWQEPTTFASISPSASDNCPAAVATFTNPRPRCLYVRFEL